MNLLFYGSLRDHDILTWVAGDQIHRHYEGTALMPNWQAYYVRGESFPVLVEEPGATVEVDFYGHLSDIILARLNDYEGSDYRLDHWDGPKGRYHFYRGNPSLTASREIWHLEHFRKHHKDAFIQLLTTWDIPNYGPRH